MQSPRKPAPFINAGMPMNNKYKILLVEDEPSIRKYVNALLNASGYIVIEAANCAEAKPCFLSHTPDLVLLDLGLPDGDGMQLLEFIRSRSAVPVIVLSARSDETDKVVALDGGDNDALYNSLLLLTGRLKGDYRVFPGHMGETTLDFERKHNPYLRGGGNQDY